MKKKIRIFAALLVMLLLLSLAACKPAGTEPSSPQQTDPTPSNLATVPTTDPTTVPTEPIVVGGPSAELRAELEAFFGEWEQLDPVGPNIVCGRYYYGVYNGYAILMFAGDLCAVSKGEIGGLEFKWGSFPFHMLAYKDGKIQELQDVYAAGLITDEQLAEIHQKHVAHHEAHPYCDCHGLAGVEPQK